MCSWSLESQSCLQSTDITGNLIVHIEENCPQYTVIANVTRESLSGSLAYSYQVRVINDLHGFLAFLNRSRLICWLDRVALHGVVVDDTIVCGTVHKWTANDKPPEKPRIVFNYVTFEGAVLRVERTADNYVLLDEHCPGANRSYCTSCSWDTPGYTHFYARCAANNTCSGPFEFYERRSTSDYSLTAVRNDVDTRLQCPELAIKSVDPPLARWNSGTPVRITVGGYAILADRRDVTVTVAGRACTAPTTVDERTLSCTVSLTTESGPSDGPVIVRYGRHDVVVSTQRFRFVYPEVRTVSPVCGPLRGGTRLRIGGRSLNTSTIVRVTVGPDALECRIIDCDDQSIYCVTAPAAIATSGPVMVLFDKSLSEHVVSSTFAYTDDLPTLNVGQRYHIYQVLTAGHNSVMVHGQHLSCVETAEIYYVMQDKSKVYASCTVEDDTQMVCYSLNPHQWTAPDPDHFGFRVIAAGSVLDISPGPDPSGRSWFTYSTTFKVVAVFVLFGFLAFYYVHYTKKRSTDTMIARNVMVEFKAATALPSSKYNNMM